MPNRMRPSDGSLPPVKGQSRRLASRRPTRPVSRQNEKAGDSVSGPSHFTATLRQLVEYLEQPGATLAAADAHRHHGVLRLAALAFHQYMPGQPGACHAEGMPDSDRAAIHIVLGGIDMQRIAAIETLAGERLVQLPEVDVVDLHAETLEQAR